MTESVLSKLALASWQRTEMTKGSIDPEVMQYPFLPTRLAPPEVYLEALDQAKEVLEQQSGIVTLKPRIPIYFLPDPQGRLDMMMNFLGLPFIGGAGNLYNAIRDGDATAVLGGDVAHSQQDDHWDMRDGRVTGVREWELAATMNNEYIAFQAVAAHPEHFFWVAGNHDFQQDSPFATSDKSVAIAKAMLAHPKLGAEFQSKWVERERMLPLAAVASDPSVIFTHAAPGPDIALADIEGKKMDAFVKLAGTENRQRMPGAMTEPQMLANMQSVVGEINGSGRYGRLRPNWTWMIGHRQTDNEPDHLRVQCGGRLRQINTKDAQAYAVITPDRGLYIGDCRNRFDKPKKVERQFA